MDISLDPDEYAQFLKDFRAADRANAATGAETQVDFDGGGQTASYFYEAPNFKCVAYAVNGGARIDLTTYNHVNNVPSCDYAAFLVALLAGGGGGTQVNANLSKVIALTSEAARSTVVERNITKALRFGDAFDFKAHELLFKNYGHSTEHNDLRTPEGLYTTTWEPLKKYHYASFFAASHLASGGTGQSEKVQKLLLL